MSIRRACGLGLLPFVASERASFIHILLRKFRMKTAQEIAVRGWNIVGLRDELYIQLCKQTSDNKKADSLTKGTLSDSDVRKVTRRRPANQIDNQSIFSRLFQVGNCLPFAFVFSRLHQSFSPIWMATFTSIKTGISIP